MKQNNCHNLHVLKYKCHSINSYKKFLLKYFQLAQNTTNKVSGNEKNIDIYKSSTTLHTTFNIGVAQLTNRMHKYTEIMKRAFS